MFTNDFDASFDILIFPLCIFSPVVTVPILMWLCGVQ